MLSSYLYDTWSILAAAVTTKCITYKSTSCNVRPMDEIYVQSWWHIPKVNVTIYALVGCIDQMASLVFVLYIVILHFVVEIFCGFGNSGSISYDYFMSDLCPNTEKCRNKSKFLLFTCKII